MKEKFVMREEELENVSGGQSRTVNTMNPIDAFVRSGPGINYPKIADLKNGTQVNTTGNTMLNPDDGLTWFEINSPLYGWMNGALLGYD